MDLQTVVLTTNPLTEVKVRGLRKLNGLFVPSPSSSFTTLDHCGTYSLEKLQG
ncbi:MAG: hypothetical protein JNN01_02920 [Opitutaceae bacterium]|nr:hypothetical protein [Opitutaceae bacterium]